MRRSYLAIDLGAESGRLMLGTLREGEISLEEIHRFPNEPIKQGGDLHWNISGLFDEIRIGLRKAGDLKIPIASISTDSWGLDYALFDAAGQIVPPTFHYRDSRTARGVERVRSTIGWAEIFEETGIQFMPFNTIYQLAAESPARLRTATQLLPIADAFNFQLCGVARAEETLASTTQLYNPRTRLWSDRLMRALDFPSELFPPIVPAGTRLGLLDPQLARECDLKGLEVIAGCSHDTAAAVAAVPATSGDWAYISSGTWSLMGAELSQPLLTDQCRTFNFTNEIGFGGTVRLLKNIIGLWIVQECRREWARQGNEWSYATLMALAASAPPFGALINPDDPRFVGPAEMPQKIAAFCRETNQIPPQSPGATIRCVLESLALLYRRTFRQLEQLTGTQIPRLHIVGGGSRNALLNQLTANALGIRVLAGPVEATALGNILVQAITAGDVNSLSAARELVANSFAVTCHECETRQQHQWDSATEQFASLP